MSEFNADEDFGFNDDEDLERDFEMTAAFEEQLVSSQAAPFFSALDDEATHTDFLRAPLPPLRSSPVQETLAPPARQQYHHHQQQRHSQRQPQREPQVDSESARLIEELQHKLRIQEHANKDLERKLRDSQDMVKTKELEYLNLKRQVQSKPTQPPTSTQSGKRVFPQAPPRPKSKIRKTATTSSQSLRSTSSSEIANAMESIHLSSQHPSPAIRQSSVMQSPTLSTQHYTPSVKLEPLSVLGPRAIPHVVPPTATNRSALPPRPPQATAATAVAVANRPNAPHLDANLNMLKVLFSDVFRETNKRKAAKLHMELTPGKIPIYARHFCSKLKPPDGACSRNAGEILSLLVSDIQETIIRSENPSFTIPSLLSQFNHCLPIYIDEKLHEIIATIVTAMKRLVTFSATAADQLVKEVKLNLTKSNVYNLVSVMAMYSFKKPPSTYHVVEEFPDIVHANSNDIILLGQKYSTMSREIAEALEYEKPPPQVRDTVLCILSILSVVGAGHSKSTLLFLLTDMAFLNLLSVDTPLDILDKACDVLALCMRDVGAIELDLNADDNTPLYVVTQLCGLLRMEEPPDYYSHTMPNKSSPSQWYSLCRKICNLLKLMAMLKLPDTMALLNKKTILSEVLAFSMRCCDFDPIHKRTDHITSHEALVQSACRALLTNVKLVQDASLLDQETISKLRNLVIFYVDKGDGTHPAKPTLLSIEKWLNQLEK